METTALPSTEEVLDWLQAVKDPEIPVLSLVDLGVITKVDIRADGHIHVVMTPTFSGCPAMEAMRTMVEDELKLHGTNSYLVEMTFDEPWTSDRLTERGRIALKQFGLAPPGHLGIQQDIEIVAHATCPYCDSTNTLLKSMFGPTLCRSLHYCNDCHQAFEQFKPV